MMDQSVILSPMEVFANVLSGIRDDTSLYENNNNNNNNNNDNNNNNLKKKWIKIFITKPQLKSYLQSTCCYKKSN